MNARHLFPHQCRVREKKTKGSNANATRVENHFCQNFSDWIKPMQARIMYEKSAVIFQFEGGLFRSFEISWVHYQKSSIMQNINPIMEERSKAICQTIPSPFALLLSHEASTPIFWSYLRLRENVSWNAFSLVSAIKRKSMRDRLCCQAVYYVYM